MQFKLLLQFYGSLTLLNQEELSDSYTYFCIKCPN
ncbi:hypothetical protein KP509_37G057200 [Ceratopteris richardii]|uniref:Uncharacterized protein n=1 Tax=Ceratopteris richardii TaxID=49495 RepID=A0A8T2Q8E2_CERRI|nr:hypothetical protein KP509_37G057200 [Ceratopteris richardii]